MISSDAIITKTEEVVLAELDGKVVMMSIENGQYYGLDEIGSIIWEKMAQPVKLEELVKELMQEYDVIQEDCEKDVISFLENLHDKKLIMLKYDK